MVELVDMILQDLGLYGYTPTTFPELIIWIVVFVAGVMLIAGTVKTFLMICQRFANGGFK